MKHLKQLLAATAIAAASTGANAALLAIQSDANTTDPYVIPANNNMPGFVGTVGQVGASVVAASSTKIQLTFELLFSEAGYSNTFSYGGNQLFQTIKYGNRDYTSGPNYVAPVSVVWDATNGDLMDFAFGTASPLGKPVISNADNGDNALRTIFTSLSGNVLYLAFDDSGAGPDDNHDDMVIRVTAKDVPEPATLALLGAGLFGLSMARRKSQAA